VEKIEQHRAENTYFYSFGAALYSKKSNFKVQICGVFGFWSFFMCTEKCNISIAVGDFLIQFCLGDLKILRNFLGIFNIFSVA
jgi:hypothetical protein